MKFFIVTTQLVVMLIVAGVACLWDIDSQLMELTLQDMEEMETLAKKPVKRMTEVTVKNEFAPLKLLSGNFIRHTRAYYQWRIKDREEKLRSDSLNIDYYNDLAVAYEKIGETQKAIDLMLKVEQLAPGRYKTAANLGTFYIHNRQLEKGLEHIKRAITINADAHFGRERYQQYLVEYVLSKKGTAPVTLPLDSSFADREWGGYASFVLHKAGLSPKSDSAIVEIRKAIKGVSGMMHFGTYNSPVLLEALGDLYTDSRLSPEERTIGAMAYKKAAREVVGVTQEYYKLKAYSVVYVTPELDDAYIGVSLDSLLAQGSAQFNEIGIHEREWIARGIDVDSAFAATYYQ